MNAKYEKYKSRGLVVLGVSHESASLLDKFVEEYKTTYPIVSAPKGGVAYGVRAYPTYVLVSATGRVIATGRPSESQIEMALESVIMFPEVPGKGGKLAALRKACTKNDVLAVAKALPRAEQDEKLSEQEKATVAVVRKMYNEMCEKTLAEIKAMDGPDYFADVDRLEGIAKMFKGLPVAVDAKARLSEIKKDTKARREIAAMTSLMKIRDKHDPRKSSSKKKTRKALKLLIKRHPGTLAAQKAEKQLSGG